MLFILKAVLVFGLPASVLGQYGSGSSSSSSVASSSTASSTASTSSAAAAPSGVHVVEVGPTLAFNPDSIVAAVGEKVEFQFNSLNHSVVQSSFDAPCVPLNGGFFSGFMPVAQGSVGVRSLAPACDPLRSSGLMELAAKRLHCDHQQHESHLVLLCSDRTQPLPIGNGWRFQRQVSSRLLALAI